MYTRGLALNGQNGTNTSVAANECLACGGQKYSPTTHTCPDDFVWPLAAPYTCGGACYDSAVFRCSGGVISPLMPEMEEAC